MRSDLIAAYRSLAASKTFTAAAVVVLALGIGATTAIYSVVDGVLLRPLPFDAPDRLVALREHRPSEDPRNVYAIAPQNFLDWDAEPGVFEALAAVAAAVSVLSAPATEPEDVRTLRTTADVFDVLGLAVAQGRPYRADEETAGRHRVAVLSHGFWQRRFGSDPALVGRRLMLDGEAFDVIGILPAGVILPFGGTAAVDVLVPLVLPEGERIRTAGVSSSYLDVVGKLRVDVSFERARSRMDAVAARLRAQHPEWNGESHVRVVPLAEGLVGGDWADWLWMILAGASSVLLIACVNLAVLQLSRASAREHEMGVRAALGGGRWRLVRLLLVENVLLALAGSVLAVVVAWWGVDVLRASLQDSLARVETVTVDVRVLAVMAALALGCGLACGLAPAWHLSSPRVASGLREGTRLVTGRSSRRASTGLVALQVALALTLLVAASLWTRSVRALAAVDPGFVTRGLLATAITPERGPTASGTSITVGGSRTAPPVIDHSPAYFALVDRLRGSPGVEHVAFVTGGIPLGGAISRTSMGIPGRQTNSEEYAMFRSVSEDYFATLDVEVLAGRAFERADRTLATPVAVVNASFATTYFGRLDVVGRTVSLAQRDHAIVGVVADVRGARLETPPEPEVTALLSTDGRSRGGELLLRTGQDTAAALTSLRAAVRDVFPGMPIRRLRTMEDAIADQSAWRRLDMWIVDLFALLGLVIAAVGVFGTLAYGVERRRREIGVRMALGATPSSVLRSITSETAWALGAGLVLGAIAARWLLAGFESQWFEVTVSDPISFITAAVALSLTALLASILPARRALDVSPAEALRVE